MESVKLLASATGSAVAARFRGLTVRIDIENSVETAVRDQVTQLPVAVPAVEHGADIKGNITLTAPPGQTRTLRGLTLTLHCAKVGGPDEKASAWSPQLPPPSGGEASAGQFGEPQSFTTLYASAEPLVALATGRYDVTGDVVVPFTLKTDVLPALESIEGSGGADVWHWIEVHVDMAGALGRMRRWRAAYAKLKRESKELYERDDGQSVAMKALTNSSGSATDKSLGKPGGHTQQRLAVQVLSATPQKLAERPRPWVTVGDFGGQCKLEVHDGGVGVLGSTAELAADVTVRDVTTAVQKVEVLVLTSVDGADPAPPTRTHLVYSSELAKTLANATAPATAADTDAPSAAASDAAASDGAASDGGGVWPIDRTIRIDLGTALGGHMQQLCRSAPQPVACPSSKEWTLSASGLEWRDCGESVPSGGAEEVLTLVGPNSLESPIGPNAPL